MSYLRVCAFAKCLRRRSLFEKCALRVSFADCCRMCVSTRNGAVRRISETPLQLQRRNVSSVLPKTECARKRVLEQSQLLDVIEARIQQLQTDIVLDVQHAKVQFVKAPSAGRGVSSGRGPKNMSQEKTDIPKSGQTVVKGAFESQPSRWMEKLTEEKKNKLKKQQHIQQKIQKNIKEKQMNKSKGSKSSSQLLQGTTKKTISTKAKMNIPVIKTIRRSMTLSEEMRAAASSTAASTAASAAAAVSHEVSKRKRKDSINQPLSETGQKQTVSDAQNMANELADIEKWERRLNQQVNQWTSSHNPERLQADSEVTACGDILLSICSYLEACVFAGEIDRAHCFLLSQHRVMSRRKHLKTSVYNIMMRVWAKRGTLHQIGRMFILLEEAGLKPNLGSYCAALECMGRNPKCSPKVITRCLSQMDEDGLSVDDLFAQCVFEQDERDMVLKAIRVIQPDYQPCFNLTTSQCSSSLVKDFYTKREDHHYPKLDFTQEELRERFKRQLSVERACTVTIDSVEGAKPVTENMAKMRELLAEQRAQWQKILLQALRESKTILANTNTKDYRLNLYPYLCLLEDREYVDIMIQSVANLPPSGESLKILAGDLGNRVYTKYSVGQKHQNQTLEKLGNIYNTFTELLAKDTKEYDVLPREQWCNLEIEQSSGPMLHGGKTSWPYIITLELGTYLVDMMVKNLKINSDILNPAYDRKLIPILYHMYTFRSTRQVGFIKPHPILTQMQQEAMETKLTFDSYVMPMVCPPVPWTSVKFGAYLLTPTKLMRSVDGATQHEVLLEKSQNLHAVLDSLNQLGNCAWRINKPLLDIIISIFNDRGSEKLDIPPPLSEAPKIPHFNPQDPTYTASEKAHIKREVINAKKKCSEMHSLRMDALYKLSIANHMRDDIFWFPHNMDFRGRTYPCPPYLNHLGSDVTRAILVFAEGKPLGPKGLDWLKIHLVNLTGLKKSSSLQGRLEYANTLMEDILDSADNPLNGKNWWMNADEPWQALACCMEIANAVRSPNPTQFISHFPVHQDGSCNGLQHYAALGRDVIGATSVNLVPCDVPQDVYSGVAQQVEEFRARDAENGLKIAKVLEGFISRKVVKQTVMTVVYGVTRYGGRLQIEKRLKEIDEFPKEHVWDASHYLVRLVFSGLKEMFTGTREIQDWLTESARLISKSGHTVEWVTPLGLPIIQPYHRTRHQVLKSTMQLINVQINHDTKEKPDTVKQKNAFPPNFIHSLDSTHMMLTALHCYGAGLTFVSVHDCFWTHALTVDTMNKVCREQFVALHSQPILQELSNFLLQKYCTSIPTEAKKKKYQEYRRLIMLLAKVPQTGDFDLQQVKESTYFFS
ncbi:DNA-directed RNA polymerase, mitochondrial [Seriola lalandi dorsalis]|uniref:DNA-directed RNA polymerase n=1 Tax=Seriola lalandi dorsalis TaxID=1841481 RepID=A0A3B4XNL4_SERLL|nr:DNA-directed RNA polymerase, mitochondrial [Seriola lalandi dorsalis]XP_056234192.1 DNA-directed RNA polymerase, mitochondrial [Seriola aureovittata]